MGRHPNLADKLVLLYTLRINPLIRTHADLARHVGIAKQTISKWLHGTATSKGDRIPHGKVPVLSRLFSIEELWWTLPLSEFQQKLNVKLEKVELSKYAKPDEVTVSFLPITGAHVYGREKELSMLDMAWKNPQVNILQLLAFGGVGKSSLVNAWLELLAKDNYRGASKVYAWSFYWQGTSSDIKASGDYFIEHALTWFGDPDPVDGTPWSKAARLVKLVRASRTLLILDGLEPLQHPPGAKSGQIDNPAVAFLVKELAFENAGLCLITSRLGVGDLAGYENGRVRTKRVDFLSDESSSLLLRTMGVVGNAADFTNVARAYTGHALSLSLLAGYLKVVHSGNLSKYREIDSLLDDQENGDHARHLMQAYLDWFSDSIECELLFLVGLFDRAVGLDELQAICSKTKIDGLTTALGKFSDPQWKYAIKQLDDSRIISVDTQSGSVELDCHPLVRDFLAEKLSAEYSSIWLQGNSAIFEYLQSTSIADPKTMTELEPLFRAVIHGTRAELYDEAFELYFDKVKKRQFSMFTEGSHYADQACIRAFFRRKWIDVVPELSEEAAHYLLSCAATNLIYLGSINEALLPSQRSIAWFQENGMWLEAAGSAAPLVSMLIATGNLPRAIRILEELEVCIEKTNNPVVQAIAQNFRAYTYYLSGYNAKSRPLFEKSDESIVKSDPECHVTFPTVSSYYCKYLLDIGEHEAALERALKTMSWREQKSWQVAIDTTSLLASDLMILGLILLEHGDHINAKINLDKQVELLKSSDEWLYLPVGLNARASYFISTGDYSAAIADLTEALEISHRTGAKFSEWESYLSFVHLHCQRSDFPAAGRFLNKAQSIEGMNEYKFRDSEIAELQQTISSGIASAAPP
ncbi:MAG: tetratricopeptide repeat protein [Pseudohongiellaceae bacterium]